MYFVSQISGFSKGKTRIGLDDVSCIPESIDGQRALGKALLEKAVFLSAQRTGKITARTREAVTHLMSTKTMV